MKICPQCNMEYQDNMKFCPECGSKLEAKPNVCPSCGTEYKEGQKFCSECGTKLSDFASSLSANKNEEKIEETYKKGVKYYEMADEEADDTTIEENYIKAYECFLSAAVESHAYAQLRLGDCYKNGHGIKKDVAKANKWYSKAFATIKLKAENGDSDAIIKLGECYLNGKGIAIDENKAIKLYTNAYKRGDAEVGAILGECYLYGNGVDEDEEKAFKIFAKCAKKGNAAAQFHLAECYDSGWGVSVDESIAFNWYLEAAETGYSEAFFYVASAYHYGKGTKKNISKAAKWYEKCTSLPAGSAYEVAECYRKGNGVEKNEEIAIRWYEKAVEIHNSAKAMFQIAELYFKKNDFNNAFIWYGKIKKKSKLGKSDSQKIQQRLKTYFNQDGSLSDFALKITNLLATHSDNPESLLMLAQHYHNINESEKAKEVTKNVAETGNKEALDMVVRLYTNKPIFEENEIECEDDKFYTKKSDIIKDKDGDAFKLFRMAAETGNAQALFIIGECYYNGWYVDKDKKEAAEWYKRAADAGHPLGRRCAKIASLELQYKINIRWNAFFVKEGTKGVSNQLHGSRHKIIFIPESVTSIAAGAFKGCFMLENVICEAPQNITVASMKEMFFGCYNLKDISFLADWNISQVKSMEDCFNGCHLLEDISPLAKWDVSNVKMMTGMFSGCKSLKDISPLSKWCLVNALSIKYMFADCGSLTKITALQNWGKYSKEGKFNNWDWASGILNNCNAITNISPLKNWGLTETYIVQHMMGRWDDTSLADYKKRRNKPTPSTNTTIAPKVDSTKVDKPSGSDPIEKSIPYVFFIKAVGFDITYPDGKRQQVKCGSSQGEIPSWTGTGFLLADGRFVTARHVVEAWSFPAGGGELDEGMVALNIVANNGGKVVAKFVAISSNGTQIQFTSDQCTINRRNDKVSLTDKGAKLVVANVDDTDYAYFHASRSYGLPHNNAASTTLARGAKLVVLGFPLGIGANSENDINPILGSGIVAAPGLQKGVILTTDTNYEQGNSGGPVFKANSNGALEVIGLVSAGAGRTMGFIVPIAAVK